MVGEIFVYSKARREKIAPRILKLFEDKPSLTVPEIEFLLLKKHKLEVKTQTIYATLARFTEQGKLRRYPKAIYTLEK